MISPDAHAFQAEDKGLKSGCNVDEYTDDAYLFLSGIITTPLSAK